MLINELNKSKGEVAIIFGRFNPPHKGHKAAWQMAAQSPIWYVGTNQSTHGPKDPLPYDIKIKAMEAIWPEIKGHIVADQSWLTLASNVYKKHGDVKLIILTDEEWVTKTINQYNGVEGPHGGYKFSNIETRPTPRLSSASALRAAVVANDKKAFADAAGVPFNLKVAGTPYFDLVSKYLLPYQEKKKKVKEVKTPWQKMEKAVPKLKGSDERSKAAIAGIKKANQDYEDIVNKEKVNEDGEYITRDDLRKLEYYLDTLFSKLGMDVNFSHHFLDRVNDPRNKKQITFSELVKLFKDEYLKYGKTIAQLGPDAEAVLKDMSSDINVPFVLTWDRGNQELDLKAKTVMRKKNFHTPDKVFAVEDIEDDSLNVHFHDTLNSQLFSQSGKLYPLVRRKLLRIAENFKSFLGVEIDGLKDITMSGSNAAYNYTPVSDIDLHLVVDLPKADQDHTYRELFDAKKYQYNAQHDYKIRGYDVELYVQNANEDHISQGIYSLLHNDWVQEPQPVDGEYDEETTRAKYDQIKHLILMAEKTQDYDLGHRLRTTIKKYRQIGLHTTGEFGPENLAFKALRANGYIKRLYDLMNNLRDREFSLEGHEQRLTEIDMSPGTLQQFSSTDAAQKTTLGFEFEMIVPHVSNASEGDSEPDYDNYDDFVSTGSIGSLVNDLADFFRETVSRREVEKAVEDANESIFEYMDEEFDQYLSTNRDDLIRAYKENTELSDEDIQISIEEMDDVYLDLVQGLRDDFDQYWDDLDGALRNLRLRKYSDWADRYGFDWPHYREFGADAEIDAHTMSELADDIATYIKMPIKSAADYHAFRKREADTWYLETDSSIDADEGDGEGGLELISPPLPLPQALEKMDQVFKWMDLNGARTDSSTGFHMNVSIPNMNSVDYVKLILFLGDQYILREFKRQANSYTRSSLERMREINAPRTIENIPNLLDSFRGGLDKAGMKIISQMLVPQGDKYVSVNIKGNYIEFRSAGGDYLTQIDKIKNTMLRYVRVINLAADPEEAKEEYAKKLYKLLISASKDQGDNDAIKWFSMYASGNFPKDYLIMKLKNLQAARQAKKNPQTVDKTVTPTGEKWGRWVVYDMDGNPIHAISARDNVEAVRLATTWAQLNHKEVSRVQLDEPMESRPTSLAGYIAESNRPFVWTKDEPKENLTEMQKACILGGHEYVGELK